MRREFRERPRTRMMRRFSRRKRRGPSANGDRRDACPTFTGLAIIVGCLVLVTLTGCRSPGRASGDRADQQHERAAIEARALRVFTNAVLLKPRENIPATDLALALAPLLIQEVAGPNTSSDCGPATIYYELGVVQIGGITRPQMTYLWSCGKESRLERGVRLTLDSHGLPVIWEVLDNRSRLSVVFVSQSLEERAKRAFGRPVAGRRFAVEQPLGVAPDVVVARVIDDAPAAMGPIVHLTVGREISTVICRCMTTQARHLVATGYYKLETLSAVKDVRLEIPGRNRRLVEKLRLPSDF